MNAQTPTTIPSPFTAARQMRRANVKPSLPSYFVVMIDYGRPYIGKKGPSGCEAIVNPETTRRDVIDDIVRGEYQNIRFIQEVSDGVATDVTLEMQVAASLAAMGRDVREAFSLFTEWCDAIGSEIADSEREAPSNLLEQLDS